MGKKRGGLTLQVNTPTRDVSYIKPKGFEAYFTLREASLELRKEPSWLRKLEADDRIPKARRVKMGKLNVRLWSPNQIEEMRTILSQMKRGRPSSG